MHNISNAEQTNGNKYKQNVTLLSEKITSFSGFYKFAPPIKKTLFFRENGYKHVCMYALWSGGVGMGVGVLICVGVDGGGTVGSRTSETKKYFCYKMVHYGIWHWCIVGFVN